MLSKLKTHSLFKISVGFLFILLLSIFADQFLSPYFQVILKNSVTINIILALSLNLVNGFTGQFSIGHAGFMALGAYFSAYLSMQLKIPAPYDILAYPIYAVLAGMFSAFAGYLVGLPSIRLKGDYLAIVTLGFSEIIRVIIVNTEKLGGAIGIYGIPGPTDFQIGDLKVSSFLQCFLLSSFFAFLTFCILWRLIRSSFGRAFLSVREDEVAAESMGINTTQTKVRAFVISAFFAGIAGSLFAHSTQFLAPSTFTFQKSVDVIIMVVLGGMGSLSGSVLAAIILSILPELILRPLQDYTGIDLRMVIFSFLLIVFMVLKPKGIFGKKELSLDTLKKLKSKWRNQLKNRSPYVS